MHIDIACVAVPRFPLALELRQQPQLRGQPVIIGGQAQQHGRVLACSPEAEACGVVPGLPLRKALALCRNGLFLPANPAREQQAAERFLDALQEASPALEPAEPGCAFVDARDIESGALAAAVHQALGIVPRVGRAPGKFAARLAALHSEVPQSLTGRTVRAFLAGLPVTLLPLDEDAQHRLLLFGIHTMGEFTALPRASVQAQFGKPGARAWDLAGGKDQEPLLPRKAAVTVTERQGLEHPASSSGFLLAVSQSLLARAFARRELQRRAARQVQLALLCEGGQSLVQTFTLQEAGSSQQRILLLLRSYLERTALPAPVEELQITLLGLTGEQGRQGSLFVERGRLKAQLDEAVRQLAARCGGRSPVFTVAEVEPWSRLPERRAALVEYMP